MQRSVVGLTKVRFGWLALLWACAGTPPPAPPTERTAEVELITASADVWAFRTTVRARYQAPEGTRCAVTLAERDHEATLAGDELAANVALSSGENVVSAHCTTPDGRRVGSDSATLTVKLPDVPVARPVATVEGDKLVLDASRSQPREGSQATLTEYTWAEVERSLSGARERPLGTGVKLELPLPSRGEHEYALHVRDDRGHEDIGRTALRLGEKGAEPLAEDGPSWLDGAVVYGVIPPLYGSPPLAAVTGQLDSLRELGVRALWISPVYATTPEDYGYAVTDFFRVREPFGSADDLRKLVREAHERGLRVLLDLVVNHSSDQHPYYRDAYDRGQHSPYYNFYKWTAPKEPEFYFNWENLPNLNYGNPEVRNMVVAFGSHWLREIDIDGYRVDAAWGVQKRRPEFYPVWSAELRRIKPNIMLLAEASARDPYYLRSGFDVAYDWTQELGQHAWKGAFEESTGIARKLAQALRDNASVSPRAASRTFRFLNNNDTGERFITRHGEPMTRVATAALLTLPGVPCVFAFDEVGAEYLPYDEAPPTTAERAGLKAYHKRLIALRASSPALARGDYRELEAGAHGELFAFARKARDTGDLAVVALNFSDKPVETELVLPAELTSATQLSLDDALMGSKRIVRRGRLKLRMTPWEALILVTPASRTTKGP
jgi:cyclomaltodextrinase / maltogenic alpha-amylase / neopullulanase